MALTKWDIVDQIQVQLGFPKNKSGDASGHDAESQASGNIQMLHPVAG
jgi:hypothetical protein